MLLLHSALVNLAAIQSESQLHTNLWAEFLDCSLLSCFALCSGGHSDYILLSSSSFHSLSFPIFVCLWRA